MTLPGLSGNPKQGTYSLRGSWGPELPSVEPYLGNTTGVVGKKDEKVHIEKISSSSIHEQRGWVRTHDLMILNFPWYLECQRENTQRILIKAFLDFEPTTFFNTAEKREASR